MSEQEWPNRGVEILLSTVIISILSTLILIWRVAYGVKTKRQLRIFDYLLIVAAVSLFHAIEIVRVMLILVVDLEYRDHHPPLQDCAARIGETLRGPQHYTSWRYHQVQLFPVPQSDHQPDRSGYFEVLHLLLPVVSEILHHIHRHCMGIYPHGHRFQLDSTSVVKSRLYTLRGKLELRR
jgi:hypothetical protein